MENNKHTYLRSIVIVLLLMLSSIMAKAQIDVHINISPPYPSKFTDYLSRPQQFLVVIHNGSNTVQNIQLRGQITGDNGIAVIANPNFKSPSPITLSPNETRNLSVNDFSALFDVDKVLLTGITKQQLINLNGVPEGNYQICLQAFDYYSGQSLSGASPTGCSNVFPVYDVETPTMITPYDGQTVSAIAGQNFIINWSTPAGSPPSTQYTVRIAEMYGILTPANAINSTQVPIFFQQTVTGVNSLLYGPAMPAMTVGRQYAIAVQAVDPFNSVTFRNKGQSEVTSFIYGDTTVVTGNLQAKKIGIIPIIPPDTINKPLPAGFNVTGNVQWYFRQSEETQAYVGSVPFQGTLSNTPGNIAHVASFHKIKVTLNPVYNLIPMTAPLPGSSKKTGVLGSEGNPDNDILQELIDEEVWSGMTVYVTTDASGNFIAPFGDVVSQIPQFSRAALARIGYSPLQSVNIQIQMDDGVGNYTMPGSSNTTSPVANISQAQLSTNQVDVGTIKPLANTYRFIPKVVDNSNTALTDAVVSLYCLSSYYYATPELHYAGNYGPDENNPTVIDGNTYIKIADINEGNTETKIFYPPSVDDYKIVVHQLSNTYNDYTTTFGLNNNTVSNINYMPVYNMSYAPTVLTGHITATIGTTELPAAGAVVSLKSVRKALGLTLTDYYSGVADSAGLYTIVNGYTVISTSPTQHLVNTLAIGSTPQIFTVTYNGQTSNLSVVIAASGKTYIGDLTFPEKTYNVSGTIVGDGLVAIPSPVMTWASGNTAIITDDSGKFTTTNIAGTDTLTISKLGYTTIKLLVQTSTTGVVSIKSLNKQSATGVLGNIALEKSIGKLAVTVVNAQNQPVANAIVSIDGVTGTTVTTNSSGVANIVGPSGNLVVDVVGPVNNNYAPMQVLVTVMPNGNVKQVTIKMAAGVRLTGTVTAGNVPIAGAVVGIPGGGMDYASVTTAADGTYSIALPATASPVEASKSGYVADVEQETLAANTTVNFVLTNAGFDASKLLGFTIVVDKVVDLGGNQKSIDGSFVNLPQNTLFSVSAGTKLKFYGVKVNVLADNTIAPVGGSVTTSQTSLSVKAFGYLPMILTNATNSPIVVSQLNGNTSHGQIQGTKLAIDFHSFMPTGIPDFGQNAYVTNTGVNTPITAITDNGTLTATQKFNFLTTDATALQVNGFSFNIDLANSYIDNGGIHFLNAVAGFANIPVLSGTKITVSDLWIGTNGYVKAATIKTGFSIGIVKWVATVGLASFGDNGFNLSGSLTLQLPSTSGTSAINFSNLQIQPGQLYGGSFTMPSSGVNMFNIATIATTQPLTFGRAGTTDTYFLKGAGYINFSGAAATYINNIKLDLFQIQTDGNVIVNATTNISQQFFGGVAAYNITKIDLNTINGQRQLYVEGGLTLTIPDVTASVGKIHFTSSGATIENFGLSFDIPGNIATVAVNIGFVSQPGKAGFEGSGNFNVPGFANIAVQFHYYKEAAGIEMGTAFSAGTQIPIGGAFVITSLGGGFNINTGEHYWKIFITGTVAVGEDVFASADIDFGIASGGVVTGHALLKVGGGINLAKADLLIDVPNSLFKVSLNVGISVPGVSVNAGGFLVLSLAPSNRYFLLGFTADASAFGIVKLNGAACVTYNLDMSKGNDPLLGQYVAAVDPQIARTGFFTGVTATVAASLSLDDVLPNFDVHAGIDFGFHSHFDMTAKGWVTIGVVYTSRNTGTGKTINLLTPTFAVDLNVDWNCGGYAYIGFFDADVSAGLNIGLNVGLSGKITINPNHIYMAASAGIQIHIFVGGISPDDCETGIVLWDWPVSHDWASICIQANIKIAYDSNNSFPYFQFN